MPLYEYQCRDCNRQFEVLTLASSVQPVRCPHCGSAEVTKLISAPCRPATSSTAPTTAPSGCPARGGFT